MDPTDTIQGRHNLENHPDSNIRESLRGIDTTETGQGAHDVENDPHCNIHESLEGIDPTGTEQDGHDVENDPHCNIHESLEGIDPTGTEQDGHDVENDPHSSLHESLEDIDPTGTGPNGDNIENHRTDNIRESMEAMDLTEPVECFNGASDRHNEINLVDQRPRNGIRYGNNSGYQLRHNPRAANQLIHVVAAHVDQDDSGDYVPEPEAMELARSSAKRSSRRKRVRSNDEPRSRRTKSARVMNQSDGHNLTPVNTTSIAAEEYLSGDRHRSESLLRAIQENNPWKDAAARPCQGCVDKRVACSFLDQNRALEIPCVSCKERKMHCVLSNDEQTTSGASQTRTSEQPRKRARFKPTKERPFRDCTRCRLNHDWCSLAVGDFQPPCNRCKAAGKDCTFEKIVRNRAGELATVVEEDEEEAEEVETGTAAIEPALEPVTVSTEDAEQVTPAAASIVEDQSGEREEEVVVVESIETSGPANKAPGNNVGPAPDSDKPRTIAADGVIRTISTQFANPIQLNFVHDVNGNNLCNWCADPYFGLKGHGEALDVQVLRWTKSDGHTEIQGGWRSRGKETDKMCRKCTTTRLKITSCPHSKLSDLDDDHRDNLCHMCTSFATFTCPKNCGLLVCDPCAWYMENEFDFDLTKLLSAIEKDHANCEGVYLRGPRADASFLLKEGEVWQRLRT
ncbi:MAG: hypothetical protein M1816_003372 [Peltula sp. TS41687]|nr:MAG: hypothetical protein M1816_003372 [Peltula sp. TS41687]